MSYLTFEIGANSNLELFKIGSQPTDPPPT